MFYQMLLFFRGFETYENPTLWNPLPVCLITHCLRLAAPRKSRISSFFAKNYHYERKIGILRFKHTQLCEYWELCVHISGGNSLNYLVGEKVKFSWETLFFRWEKYILWKYEHKKRLQNMNTKIWTQTSRCCWRL